MTAIDWNLFTDTPLQSDLMRRLFRLYEKTTLMRDGDRWTAPKVDWLARQLGVHKSTVSRALKALAGRGLILLRKWRWSRSPRLYIKVLIRPRNVKAQRERNLTETQNATCYYNTDKEISPSGNSSGASPEQDNQGIITISPEKDRKPPSPPSRNPGRKIKGSGADAATRAETRREEGPGVKATNPHKPSSRELQRRWDGLLRANCGIGVPDDNKTLRHVGIVRDRMTAAGVNAWDELPRVIDRWNDFSQKKAGPNAHPWAVIRALPAYLAYRETMDASPTNATQVPVPAPAPTTVHAGASDEIAAKHKAGNGFMFAIRDMGKKKQPTDNQPTNGSPDETDVV